MQDAYLLHTLRWAAVSVADLVPSIFGTRTLDK